MTNVRCALEGKSTVQDVQVELFHALSRLEVFMGKVAGCIDMGGHMYREILEQGLVGKVALLNARVPLPEFSQAAGGVPVQRAGMQLLCNVYDMSWDLCSIIGEILRKADYLPVLGTYSGNIAK